jgi:hypothetical protein
MKLKVTTHTETVFCQEKIVIAYLNCTVAFHILSWSPYMFYYFNYCLMVVEAEFHNAVHCSILIAKLKWGFPSLFIERGNTVGNRRRQFKIFSFWATEKPTNIMNWETKFWSGKFWAVMNESGDQSYTSVGRLMAHLSSVSPPEAVNILPTCFNRTIDEIK